MRSRGLAMFLAAILSAGSALGADPLFARVLLPIAVHAVPGVSGSVWETELFFRNDADTPVQISPLIAGDVAPTSKITLPLRIHLSGPHEPPGAFIYVTRAVVDEVRFNATLRNLGRENQTWGIEIPVVRENDFQGSRLVLINVPTDAQYRQALRMYEGDLDGTARVRVEIFDERSSAPKLPLVSFEADLPSATPYFKPGYAQFLWLAEEFPAIRAVDRVRLEITGLTPGANLWAFVSLTNNLTNEITLVTPQ